MTITVPTGEFVGLLRDIIPFAFPDDDMPDLNIIRLEWDGFMLHASATDSLRMVRSSWHPDDDETGTSKPGLVSAYGGADDRWVVFVRLDEAKEMVNHFRLPAKEAGIPLTLDHQRGQLKVARSADTGHQDVKVVVTTRYVEFPDLAKTLDADPVAGKVEAISYVGRHLADFCLVRQRGTFTLTFCGSTQATRVTIGDRFVGTIRPDRTGQEARIEVLV